ncbi:hypothetical protein QYE76_050372 [Lolium multiflorum]|uniref:Uncharacterized protein n=1 Tax=Lolium multiflorum TaxID=4521 RepID=A0AAD8WJ57_LOLMU|nr:hypothetical protein QYE76_050372 [Lolium multiflorum]
MAKKGAKKPPGKETKGAKAPFAKPRKASALKKKPEGWTDDQWHQDCLRRNLSTAEWKGRRAAQLEKKALAARAHQHALAGCIAATNASPWRTMLSPYISGVLSPSTSGFYNDCSSATPGTRSGGRPVQCAEEEVEEDEEEEGDGDGDGVEEGVEDDEDDEDEEGGDEEDDEGAGEAADDLVEVDANGVK